MPPAIFSSRARRVRAVAACAVLLALVGYVAAHLLTGGGGPPRCTARADGERVSLDPEQTRNAASIVAVGRGRGLPERAVTIALATAMQESGLRNIQRGDRDSLGLFQQRPSQGWGTREQILDPVYSAGAFYDRLVRVPGYSRLPLTVAAQRVQFSGFPQAYAKHETEAQVLTEVLRGRAPAAFGCPGPPDDGSTGDPAKVRAALKREFGSAVPASGAGRVDGTTGTLLVPVRAAVRADVPRHGWELAYWAVAHSDELRIERVSYQGQVWSARNSSQGWYAAPDGKAGNSDREVSITVAR
ncbi:hypothetical protein [Streptomyces palmae]|uniref:ARB-07466-like C-terminal domain-containing protein n=1 Tax=Streptomyces palmae TaxID=1701085 RepID=A0A4Z0H6N8_9ACTN|nr:hypothetical protein [Streptomyces palmae]TGB08779.1 hypothetical protein E4099_14855 [Streptomyces palmae]